MEFGLRATEELISRKPAWSEAYRFRGIALARAGRYLEAKLILEQGLDLPRTEEDRKLHEKTLALLAEAMASKGISHPKPNRQP